MGASRSRRGLAYSASRINSSPLPKLWCRALTSPSSYSKHCHSFKHRPCRLFPSDIQIARGRVAGFRSFKPLLLRRWGGRVECSPAGGGPPPRGARAAGGVGVGESRRDAAFSGGGEFDYHLPAATI